MKNVVLFFMILSLCTCSCTSSKDVLAVFNGGVIERGELKDWMTARNINPDELRKDPEMQKTLLRQLALEKIIYNLASGSGFAGNTEFAIIREAVYRNFLSSYYYNRHLKSISFSETSTDVSIIRIFFKGGIGGREYREKEALIKNVIIPALNNGVQFGDLAKQYSEDSAKRRGGSLGFVLTGMLENEMAAAVASLEEGAFTTAPVLIGNSLCVIKVNRKAVITHENINTMIPDSGNRERILAFIKRREMAAEEELLKSGGNVKSGIQNAALRSDNEVLFTVDGKVYTLGYIKSILRIFYILKRNEVVTDFSAAELRFTADRVMNEILASSRAEKLGYQNDPEFADRWKYLDRATFTGMYKSIYLIQNVNITDKEIEDAYKSQLQLQKRVKEDGNAVTRAVIRSRLYRSKFMKVKSDWETGLLRDYNYTIR